MVDSKNKNVVKIKNIRYFQKMNRDFKNIFPKKHSIIGMIHLQALPGTPMNQYAVEKILELALIDAAALQLAGADGLIIENMHDVPYLNRTVGPEIIASMSVVAKEIKKEIELPCGIQVLAGANQGALAIAKAANLDFVRAEGFVFGHVADEGWINSDAGDLLRYRKMIGAEDVLIFTDLKKKHSSHAITSDVDLLETARAAEFFLSDGLIITGTSTGAATSLEDIKIIKENCEKPVLVGSGVTLDNVKDYFQIADALIIGSYFKENGDWKNKVEYDRVARLMAVVNEL